MLRDDGGRNVVIVHGAFGGGWEWTGVAARLRRKGHEVWTPTLTGLGDRAHLGRPETDLSTHVQDLVAVIDCEGLEDVVLCAASYGGMPATGAADQRSRQVRGMVYVDAIVPRHGLSAADLLPASFAAALREDGAGVFRAAVPPGVLPPRAGIPAAEWQAYVSRLVDQPKRTFMEPIRLTGAIERVPRAFVRCTRSVLPDDPITPMATAARQAGWVYRELEAPHDPQLFVPDWTAQVIDEVVRTAFGTNPPR